MTPSQEHNNQKSESDSEQEQYYRLVPAEQSRTYEYGTISLTEFLRYYWEKRPVIYWSLGIFLALGLFFAFFSPVEYKSEASIIPEYELQDRVNEIIESYGLLFGLTGSIRENRTPSYLLELYPYMINSMDFQRRLIHHPFRYERRDTTITMFDYFTKVYRPSLTNTIYRYTIGLPGTIANALQPGKDQEMPPVSGTDSVAHISPVPDSQFPIPDLDPREQRVINELSSRITATYLRGIGIVHVETRMPEPRMAATLTQLTLEVLYEKAREYKTAKGDLYLQFLETQRGQAQAELKEAREELIQFRNSEQQLLNERMELQSTYEAALSRYNSILEQINRIEADIQEQLPVFRILDDITLPGQKSEPNRKMIITFSLLLGIFLAVCWITILFFGSRLRGERKTAS